MNVDISKDNIDKLSRKEKGNEKNGCFLQSLLVRRSGLRRIEEILEGLVFIL